MKEVENCLNCDKFVVCRIPDLSLKVKGKLKPDIDINKAFQDIAKSCDWLTPIKK